MLSQSGTVPLGELLQALASVTNGELRTLLSADGVPRYRVAGGWISERLRGGARAATETQRWPQRKEVSGVT